MRSAPAKQKRSSMYMCNAHLNYRLSFRLVVRAVLNAKINSNIKNINGCSFNYVLSRFRAWPNFKSTLFLSRSLCHFMIHDCCCCFFFSSYASQFEPFFTVFVVMYVCVDDHFILPLYGCYRESNTTKNARNFRHFIEFGHVRYAMFGVHLAIQHKLHFCGFIPWRFKFQPNKTRIVHICS